MAENALPRPPPCALPPYSHHLVARVYESKAEFRSALQHEKEGYTIYKTQVGQGRAQGGVKGGAEGGPHLSPLAPCSSARTTRRPRRAPSPSSA